MKEEEYDVDEEDDVKIKPFSLCDDYNDDDISLEHEC